MVSVAICMHNARPFIDQALRSVLAQSYQGFEIVIVDDGSTDGSADHVIRTYRDSRLRVIRQTHQTLRGARPQVLAHSRGDLIAFLDHDDVWLPDKLERQVAALQRNQAAALTFSDCWLIDSEGQRIGRDSDRYRHAELDLRAEHAHLSLLRYGCFVVYSTAMVRAAALQRAGGFHRGYQYVSDYDLWLRLSRRQSFHYIDEPLVEFRIHETQFTKRRVDVTLPEHRDLLEPIRKSSSYPASIRIALGDMLLGQHRYAARQLWHQGRYVAAARTAVQMCRYPDRLSDSLRHSLRATIAGPLIESSVTAGLHLKDWIKRGWHVLLRLKLRAADLLQRVRRRLGARIDDTQRGSDKRHVWIDGTCLGREQTGYFNLLAELVRRLSSDTELRVHVVTSKAGRAALSDRLGTRHSVQFESCGWRAVHWTHVHELLFGYPARHAGILVALLLALVAVWTRSPVLLGLAGTTTALVFATTLDELESARAATIGRPRHRLTARAVRFLWRRLPTPRRRTRLADVTEVLFWRGRFKWRNANRIAIVQDMTTRTHPELHTPGNVEEFDEFLGYLQRHAHRVATVSHCSRHDIVERIAVCPTSVDVLPMPIHPRYQQPTFERSLVDALGIRRRYVLSVATVEPRKNLRRLVRAFELVRCADAAADVMLVLVGQQGWDGGFSDFLSSRDTTHIMRLGFAPGDALPSLYHYASAVICPSLYEGFGLPVMEAMCCSAVVLASESGSLPEVLGGAGVRFNPLSIESMAAAILEVLSMPPGQTDVCRRQGRERAERHLEQVVSEGSLPGIGNRVAATHA
jgi:alpha-1,3-rhamnosyl/mannosyltransferase